MTNFTKGEWKVTKYGYEKYSVNGGNGEEVCSCWNKHNANLIEVSPKMYEMLGMLSELMEFLDERTHPNIELDVVKYDIDKLLSKARGENE